MPTPVVRDMDIHVLTAPCRSRTVILLDEIREGLGTSEMSLEEMVVEMHQIRESSDYDAQALNLLFDGSATDHTPF